MTDVLSNRSQIGSDLLGIRRYQPAFVFEAIDCVVHRIVKSVE